MLMMSGDDDVDDDDDDEDDDNNDDDDDDDNVMMMLIMRMMMMLMRMMMMMTAMMHLSHPGFVLVHLFFIYFTKLISMKSMLPTFFNVYREHAKRTMLPVTRFSASILEALPLES